MMFDVICHDGFFLMKFRSPLKRTLNTAEGLQSTASESGLDAILSKNNKHLGTGTNSLQSSELPSDEEDLSLGDTEQYRSSPTAPRGSPMADASMPRDSSPLNIVVNMDCLNQTETFDEGSSGSFDDDSEDDQLPPGVCMFQLINL